MENETKDAAKILYSICERNAGISLGTYVLDQDSQEETALTGDYSTFAKVAILLRENAVICELCFEEESDFLETVRVLGRMREMEERYGVPLVHILTLCPENPEEEEGEDTGVFGYAAGYVSLWAMDNIAKTVTFLCCADDFGIFMTDEDGTYLAEDEPEGDFGSEDWEWQE